MELAILGHSFVNKLETFAQRDWQNLNIDPSKVVVSYNGISGGTFKDFRKKEYTNCLKSENVKNVICQMGGNDLDSASTDADQVASCILAYAEYIKEGFNLDNVVILQLLFRGKTRHVDVDDYNDSVIEVNKSLKESASHKPWLTYWTHKGLKQCAIDPYNHDRVHLNDFGMLRYIHSVRGAALYLLRC